MQNGYINISHFPINPTKINIGYCITGLQMGKLLGKPRPLDSRNRVTLPPEILDLLKLKPNDEIFFRLDDGKIVMGKALIKYELIDEVLGGKKK